MRELPPSYGAACQELKETAVQAAEVPAEMPGSQSPHHFMPQGPSSQGVRGAWDLCRCEGDIRALHGTGCSSCPSLCAAGSRGAAVGSGAVAGHPALSCALPFAPAAVPRVRAPANWLARQKPHFPGAGTQKITDNTGGAEESRSRWWVHRDLAQVCRLSLSESSVCW